MQEIQIIQEDKVEMFSAALFGLNKKIQMRSYIQFGIFSKGSLVKQAV